MVNQTSALSAPGRVKVKNFPCVNPFLPLYDQKTYSGRLSNCFRITNPMLMFASTKDLLRARCIVAKYRKSQPLPSCLKRDEVIDARILYESSFHPVTGDKIFFLSRLCSQIPMKALLLGSILTYYDYCLCTNVIPWTLSHVLYQSYLAMLNYSNRSYSKFDSFSWASSFLVGTGVGIGTHWFLCNNISQCKHPFLRRFIPLFSVAAATLAAVPIMRYRELLDGIPVYDKNERHLGYSKRAAFKGVTSTTISRVLTILPGMALSPLIMENLYRRGFLCRYPWSILPINIAIMAGSLFLSVPMSCALFPQRYTVPLHWLEKDIQKKAKLLVPPPKTGYFMKGN